MKVFKISVSPTFSSLLFFLFLLFAGKVSFAQQNGYKTLMHTISDASLQTLKGSLIYNIRVEIENTSTVKSIDYSLNVPYPLRKVLADITTEKVNWSDMSGKKGHYFVVIPVYYLVQHDSGAWEFDSKEDITDSYQFDKGPLYPLAANTSIVTPVFVQGSVEH
jgi:hypothetical protein